MTDDKDLIISALLAKFSGPVTIHAAELQQARFTAIARTILPGGLSYSLEVQRQPAAPSRSTRGPDLPPDPIDGDIHIVEADDTAIDPLAVIGQHARAQDDPAVRRVVGSNPAAGEVAGKAVQVIGEIATAGGIYDHPDVQRAITYFANGAEGEILPFHVTLQPPTTAQWSKTHCRQPVGECVCTGRQMDDCENAYTPGVADGPNGPEPTWRDGIEERILALEQAMWPLQSHPVAAARADLRAARTEPMPAFPSAAPECKGAWALGTACARCSKCRQTAPEEARYAVAVDIVREFKKPSTSFLQRKMQIGFNAACRLLERMEDEDIVSKENHAGKRELLKP